MNALQENNSLKDSKHEKVPISESDQQSVAKEKKELENKEKKVSKEVVIDIYDHKEFKFEAKIQETLKRLSELPNLASEIKLPEVEQSITNIYTKLCKALNVPISSTFLSHAESEEMDFSYHSLGPVGIIPVTKALIPCRTVKQLNLSYNKLGAQSLPAISLLVDRNESIFYLNLSNNCIGRNSTDELGKLIYAASNVEILNLSGNDIGDEGINEIGTVLMKTDKVKELDLSKNGASSVSGHPFGLSIGKCSALEKLDLSYNHFGGGVSGVCEGLKKSNLKCLKLKENGICDEAMVALEASLRKNKSLQELDLTGNYITKKGINTLSTGVKKSSTLQTLKMANNPFQGAAANVLLASVGPSLKHLDLSNIKVDEPFMKTLKKFTKSGRDLEVLYGTKFRYDCFPRDYNVPIDNTVTDSNALEVLQKLADEKGVSLKNVLKSIHASFMIQKAESAKEAVDTEDESESEIRTMTPEDFSKALTGSQISIPRALARDIAKACSVDGRINMWELIMKVNWKPDELIFKCIKKQPDVNQKDKKKEKKLKGKRR